MEAKRKLFGKWLLTFVFFGALNVSALAKEGEYLPFQLRQQSGPVLSVEVLQTEVEAAIFRQTNESRQSRKIPRLSLDEKLARAARDHAADMLKRRYLSHFSPEKLSVVDRVGKYLSTRPEALGENLHVIQSHDGLRDPEAISRTMLQDWTRSPSHAKNLFQGNFTHLGVGCASDGKAIDCVQVFRR